ncbi:glycosyl hydrolase family 28 [Colletotrichum karsti]|uniref:galacturonan 1,4-alpha-galacturonidase n=1 Tax=Colletotrichum karsti TaxID=1095194 RepID=A0A9P6LHW7_9PEZI|nr:glycosyl hydrolase family 28 [Colletotrichum karsti]KAF9873616.1 glycosyl hydrolase family 28 [Colletotrichum karsti]
MDAVKNANNGGAVYLPAGETFVIGKPLDLTFLNNIHIRLEGTIRFTNDVEFWQANAFYHPFQRSLMFWKWGGKDVWIHGEGVIDGQGQRWWNEFSGQEILDPDNEYLRPILFYAEGIENLVVEGILMKNSPVWHNFIVESKHITYRDVIVEAKSNNSTVEPKNGDFFNSLNVEHIRIERVWVDSDDDCFSPKSNNTDIHVNTMYCNNSHGQSLGSLGQYEGEYVFVKDVVIENVWMLNGNNGARIKVWAGENVATGFVENVTFRNFWSENDDWPVFLDSCYFNIDAETCNKFPSKMKVSNVLFENFRGISSGSKGRAVARSFLTPTKVDLSSAPGPGSSAPSTTRLPFPRSDSKPTVVAFLRHCGCPFAEKTFRLLRDAASQNPDIAFVAVSHSSESHTNKWVSEVGGAGTTNPVQVVLDEERSVYAKWGLGVSGFLHVLSPGELSKVFSLAWNEGIKNRPTESGNRWQTSGTWAVDAQGKVVWGGISKSASDIPDFDNIVSKLKKTGE